MSATKYASVANHKDAAVTRSAGFDHQDAGATGVSGVVVVG
jgi:hypothetical protein